MPAPLTEVLEDDLAAAEAMDLILAGKTTREAAKILGIAQSTVGRRVAVARAAFRERYLATKYEEWIAESLQRTEWAQREAARSWERSKRGGADDGDEVFPGDPRFLAEFMRCEDRRAGLLGLDMPKRVEITPPGDFIPNPQRAARESGLTLAEATAEIEAFLGGEVAN